MSDFVRKPILLENEQAEKFIEDGLSRLADSTKTNAELIKYCKVANVADAMAIIEIAKTKPKRIIYEAADVHDLDRPFTGRIFPVYANDTLETLFDRYALLFPGELKILMRDFADKQSAQYNANGMTQGKTMRFYGQIPNVFYQACIALDEHFWTKNFRKSMRRLGVIAPKLFQGSV